MKDLDKWKRTPLPLELFYKPLFSHWFLCLWWLKCKDTTFPLSILHSMLCFYLFSNSVNNFWLWCNLICFVCFCAIFCAFFLIVVDSFCFCLCTYFHFIPLSALRMAISYNTCLFGGVYLVGCCMLQTHFALFLTRSQKNQTKMIGR